MGMNVMMNVNVIDGVFDKGMLLLTFGGGGYIVDYLFFLNEKIVDFYISFGV